MSDKITHIGQLKPDQRNPRRHNQRNIGLVVDSLQQVGFARSIVIDEDGTILAGNGVTEAAGIAGIEKVIEVEADGETIVAVRRRGLSDEQKTKLKYYDNRSGELADWDASVVVADLELGLDLSSLWNPDELSVMLEGAADSLLGGNGAKDVEPQIDKAAELKEKWSTALGQVWQLGEHRIVCGDCTDAAVVEMVMRGERAGMVFTDPPYNVDIAGGTHDPRDTKNYRGGLKIENDAMSDSEFDLFLLKCFQVLNSMILRSGGVYYVCAPAGRTETQFRNAIDSVLTLRQCIVWVKQQFVFGRQDYHWRHESILYGWKDGAGHYFSDDKTQDTVWEIDRPMRSEKEHPTQKPIELPVRAIGNSSKLNWIVFDGFLGSGSTLIACENLKRKCRGVEIDPGYLAVTIQRWADLTGRDPIRLSE